MGQKQSGRSFNTLNEVQLETKVDSKVQEAIDKYLKLASNDHQAKENLIREYMPFGIFNIVMAQKNKVKDGDYLFVLLCITKDHDYSNLLLEYVSSEHYNPNINSKFSNASYLMWTIAKKKSKALIDKIIERGNYQPDCVNIFGETALMLACAHKHIDIVLKLLEQPCRVDAVTKDGEIALQLAIKYNLPEEVISKIVVECVKANKNGLYSTLAELITKKQKVLVGYVAKNFMHTDIFNLKYKYASAENIDCEDYLFAVLVSFGQQQVAKEYIESKYYDPKTAPILASQHTYLIKAINNHCEDLAQAIIGKGDCKIGHLDNYNDTALIYACYRNMPNLATKILMLDEDCKAHVFNNGKISAMCYATQYNMYDVIRLIYKKLGEHTNDHFRHKCSIRKAPEEYLFYFLLKHNMIDVLEDYIDSKQFPISNVTYSLSLDNYIGVLVHANKWDFVEKIVRKEDKNTKVTKNACDLYRCCFDNQRYDLAVILLEIWGSPGAKNIFHVIVDGKKKIDDHDLATFIEITTNSEYMLLMYHAIKNNWVEVVDNMVSILNKGRESLKVSDIHYKFTTEKILTIVCKMNQLSYVDKFLEQFVYDQAFVLPLYKSSSKQVRQIIMKHFDLNDTSFLIEKYGIEKINIIASHA